MIEVKQLYKSFTINNSIIRVLEDINLSISRGEIFGIIGESGAGKSTLIRTLNYLEKPSSGEVWIDNINLSSLKETQLRKERQQIGMIFQHFNLLTTRTAFENVALPLELIGAPKEEIERKVLPLLTWVGLSKHKNHFPDQLSGGQKQRVAIARALVTQPRLLLCDEVTSALDPKATLSILNLLKEINQKLKITIVLITHEMDAIKHICDRAAVLDRGRLVECASVLQLFSQPKSSITQELVQKFLHLELPNHIKHKLQTNPAPHKTRLVRFTFVGTNSGEPIISHLVKNFDIMVNIIQANIENVQQVTIGFTVCQLIGSAESIDDALAYVKTTSILVEVLGYV